MYNATSVTHNKQLFVIYMKFKFSWASCILSGNPSWGRGGKNIRVSLDYEKIYNCYCSSKFYSD